MTAPDPTAFASLTEGLAPADAFMRGWLQQVVLRLRRELAWAWRHQESVDRVADALQRQSLAQERLEFFRTDPAAHHLDAQLRELDTAPPSRSGHRGGLQWLTRELHLGAAETFVLALALAAARDAATGDLIAALHGDVRKTAPTLALAQRLWGEPRALVALQSGAHPLFARGLLRREGERDEWTAAIRMPGLVAQLLEYGAHAVPVELEDIARPGRRRPAATNPATGEDTDLALLAARMRQPHRALRVVPVAIALASGTLDAKRAAATLARLASLTRRPVLALRAGVAASASVLEDTALFCWLRGADLLLSTCGAVDGVDWRNLLRPFPICVFAPARDDGAPRDADALPTLVIPTPDYAQRLAAWHGELARHGLAMDVDATRECAFRFRLDASAIADVVTALTRTSAAPGREQMIAACQQQTGLAVGTQAQRLTPRFRRRDLVLDAEHGRQFDQLLAAMRNLARVHADWGTAQAWGDAGISALFAGASGTGKTMAAEVLAAELQMPLYHVDLSQVVSKYIGETEKNLRQLFDAAEQSDAILFFDEADSLFGTRTQARSANDRFANMEISYLLQRMDRFRGLAILATNRRKDLDEAFLRRLRYIIEFPLPSESERLAIWRTCIPPAVSTAGLDLALLAREFALPGGNIRSIVLNACLAASATRVDPALDMASVMSAIDREYDKIGRPLTREQKARWSAGSSAAAGAPPQRPGALQ